MIKSGGFTLAELLTVLAVLGIISTFTLTKVITSNQNATKNAATKEIMSVLADGFMSLKQQGRVTISTTSSNILNGELNFVNRITSGLVDAPTGQGSVDCSNVVHYCYRLHNGGVVMLHSLAPFVGTSNSDAITAWFDPDGSYSGSTTGPGKGILILIFYNGRITTMSGISNPTYSIWGTLTPFAQEPEWFRWN